MCARDSFEPWKANRIVPVKSHQSEGVSAMRGGPLMCRMHEYRGRMDAQERPFGYFA